MTYYYQFTNNRAQSQDLVRLKKTLEHVSNKANWRIVELANGFYQSEHKPLDGGEDAKWVDTTRRETIEGAERAIDASIDHYKKKLRAFEGPKVVKTF
tara:strand:+ start:1303 stop:1596 length:294 start_codon:yes stop_codon:yes gene_type:complete